MADNPSFSEDFKRIQEEYIKGLPEKLQSMTNLVSGFKNGATQASVAELRTHVHQLAGNAATFGFQEATDLCKNWDMKLKEIADNFSPEKIQPLLNDLEAFLGQLKKSLKLA